MRHRRVLIADRIDWDELNKELAPSYAENGWLVESLRSVIGNFLLKTTYRLSDEPLCDR